MYFFSFFKKIKIHEYKSRFRGEQVDESRFIDSFKFFQTSLANLVSNLQPEDFCNKKYDNRKIIGTINYV